MQDKKKIYLVFTGIALIICVSAGAIGYFFNNTSGVVYGVAAGLIISAFTVGCLHYLPAFAIIRLYGGKEVMKKDSPDFIKTIEEFAETVNIPVPKFYSSNKDIPLIFTIGRDYTSASIIFTDKLMDILFPEELTCVILHEMAHIKHEQILRQTLVAFVAGTLTMFATAAQWSAQLMGFGQEDDPVPQIIKFFAMALVAPPAALLIQLTIPDRREYIADTMAIEIYNKPEIHIHMLEKIARCFKETRYEEINPAHGLLNIVDPLPLSNDTKDDFYTLFNTHPDIDRRIEAIQTRWTASMGLNGYSATMKKKANKYKIITRWKKTLVYSIISHMLIMFGIVVVYTYYNNDFIVKDSLIITKAYLGMLVITHSMMYLMFRKRL
jgi:heat shock protein HtpX